MRPIIKYFPEIEFEYECDIKTLMSEIFDFDYSYYLEDISNEEYELILLKKL